MAIDAIKIKNSDNVATALREINAAESIQCMVGDETLTMDTGEYIQYGHKFATESIAKGDNIIKYGEVIGRATADIARGFHVHIHNVESLRGRGDLETENG